MGIEFKVNKGKGYFLYPMEEELASLKDLNGGNEVFITHPRFISFYDLKVNPNHLYEQVVGVDYLREVYKKYGLKYIKENIDCEHSPC